jgi:DNA polymerase-3 subunit beta
MKIKVLKENLVQNLALASRFTNSGSQSSLWSSILIQVKGKEIHLSAHDGSKGVKLRLPGKIEEEGSVVVQAKIFLELVQGLPLGAVELSVNSEGLMVRAGRVRAQLAVSSGEVLGEELGGVNEGVDLGEVEIVELDKVWSRVQYAVSRDEARPVLTGVLWEIGRGRMVATDGFRLSVIKKVMKVKDVKLTVDSMLIPASLIQELIKVAQERNVDLVKLRWEEKSGRLWFWADDLLIMGKVIEGEYPNYRAILPKDYAQKIRVDRQMLLDAVKAVSIFARESANIVKLQGEEARILLTANSPQLGSGEVEVEVLNSFVSVVETAFNCRYLIDYLTSVHTSEIEIGFNESLQPVGFFDVEDVNSEHIIMPVRVKD